MMVMVECGDLSLLTCMSFGRAHKIRREGTVFEEREHPESKSWKSLLYTYFLSTLDLQRPAVARILASLSFDAK